MEWCSAWLYSTLKRIQIFQFIMKKIYTAILPAFLNNAYLKSTHATSSTGKLRIVHLINHEKKILKRPYL